MAVMGGWSGLRLLCGGAVGVTVRTIKLGLGNFRFDVHSCDFVRFIDKIVNFDNGVIPSGTTRFVAYTKK